MNNLYQIRIDKDKFVTKEILSIISQCSAQVNKEISIYINRTGRVVDVSIGSAGTVPLPRIKGERGIRCIHTHPQGQGELSSIDISALKQLGLDAIAAIGVCEGRPKEIYCAFNQRQASCIILGPYFVEDMENPDLMVLLQDYNGRRGTNHRYVDNAIKQERAITVAVFDMKTTQTEMDYSLGELNNLAATAGAIVVDSIYQRRSDIDAAYYLGRGKVEQLGLLRQHYDADLVIVNDELTPGQLYNLQDAVGVKVIDRTTLILDIFAQRASSHEGKLQVELAQLEYRLSKLTGVGHMLSRLGGGIGTRGPGETKLESDRRHIRRRINQLRKELNLVKKYRSNQRKKRIQSNLPIVALVGYTNSGKSTLLNRLTGSNVLAEDKLFATLDAVTRTVNTPSNKKFLLVDTVGFVDRLPHHLIEAFKSTLEEINYAQVILHIIDGSSSNIDGQVTTVLKVLNSLGVDKGKVVDVYNKADISSEKKEGLWISALTGQGIPQLLYRIEHMLFGRQRTVEMLVPYNSGSIISQIFKGHLVDDYSHEEAGVRMQVNVTAREYEMYKRFIVKTPNNTGF
ncbi:MAG: GTPase HflX [Mahellales bacterium]